MAEIDRSLGIHQIKLLPASANGQLDSGVTQPLMALGERVPLTASGKHTSSQQVAAAHPWAFRINHPQASKDPKARRCVVQHSIG